MGQRAVCQILRGGTGATTRATSTEISFTDLHKPLAEAERSQERAFDLFGHGDGEPADVRLVETVRLCGDFGPGYGATWQRSHASHWAVRLTGRLALGRKTRGASRAFGERGRSRSGPGLWRRIALWPAGRSSRLRRRS